MLIKNKPNWFYQFYFFLEKLSLFFYSHKLLERSLSSSPILAPVGLLSFMRIYFLPGHKEMEGLRTLRNLSETTAPWRSAQTRRLRQQRVEGKKVGEKKGRQKPHWVRQVVPQPSGISLNTWPLSHMDTLVVLQVYFQFIDFIFHSLYIFTSCSPLLFFLSSISISLSFLSVPFFHHEEHHYIHFACQCMHCSASYYSSLLQRRSAQHFTVN